MGIYLFDQYSLLHFSIGVVAFFFKVPLTYWIFLHILFEIVENTQTGIYIINNYLPVWPGGKPKADSIINQVGDTISAILGWVCAYLINYYGSKYGWYEPHPI